MQSCATNDDIPLCFTLEYDESMKSDAYLLSVRGDMLSTTAHPIDGGGAMTGNWSTTRTCGDKINKLDASIYRTPETHNLYYDIYQRRHQHR